MAEVAAMAAQKRTQTKGCHGHDEGKGQEHTGAYCHMKNERYNYNHHMPRLADTLLQAGLFQGQSVMNIGGGYASWDRYLMGKEVVRTSKSIPNTLPEGLEFLRPSEVACFDGEYDVEWKSAGETRWLDLTLPTGCLMPMSDWTISFEVGEHIPPQLEAEFVNNVADHARHGVVLSWGLPDQGGHKHVNGRSLEYLQDVMAAKGFKACVKMSEGIRARATAWFAKSTQVFMRPDFAERAASELGVVCE